MRWSIIWELIKINILYANPQFLVKAKKKQAKKKEKFSAYRSVLLQFLFLSIMMGTVYSVFILGIDYSRSIGFFSIQLAVYASISLVYGFTGFFSIFYDSKDTKLYLPLPVKPEEVFLAKLLSAQSMTLPLLMPCLSLLVITYWQIGGPVTSLLAIPSFLLLLVLVNLINLTFVHFLGQLLTLSPYKTAISTILSTVSSLLGFAGLMFLQSQQTASFETGGVIEFSKLPVFVGFHYLASQPFSIDFLLHMGFPLLALLGLSYYGYKRVIPAYFEQILLMETTARRKKNKKQGKLPTSLRSSLVKHHLSTLKDSNLIVQTYLQPFIMLIALAPSMSRLRELTVLRELGWEYFGIALLIGFLFGNMMTGSTTFIGVAMSLEKENYHFIKTLPISFKQFTIQKFLVIFAIQFLPPLTIIFIGLAVFLKLNFFLIISLMIGAGLSAILVSQYYYRRDQKLLLLNWQNSNQLFGRGKGQWFVVFSLLAGMIIGAGLTMLSVILTYTLGTTVVSGMMLGLVLLTSILLQLYFYHSYWKKLS